jgi:hypothetical protein
MVDELMAKSTRRALRREFGTAKLAGALSPYLMKP